MAWDLERDPGGRMLESLERWRVLLCFCFRKEGQPLGNESVGSCGISSGTRESKSAVVLSVLNEVFNVNIINGHNVQNEQFSLHCTELGLRRFYSAIVNFYPCCSHMNSLGGKMTQNVLVSVLCKPSVFSSKWKFSGTVKKIFYIYEHNIMVKSHRGFESALLLVELWGTYSSYSWTRTFNTWNKNNCQ